MKILTGTLLLTMAVFLPNSVESRPGSQEKNMNMNNNNNNNNDYYIGRGWGPRRATLSGPDGVGVVHADYSQESVYSNDSIHPYVPRREQQVRTSRRQKAKIYYERNEAGQISALSHVVLPHTAPRQHTRVDYTYEVPAPIPHDSPSAYLNLDPNTNPHIHPNYNPNIHPNYNPNIHPNP